MNPNKALSFAVDNAVSFTPVFILLISADEPAVNLDSVVSSIIYRLSFILCFMKIWSLTLKPTLSVYSIQSVVCLF